MAKEPVHAETKRGRRIFDVAETRAAIQSAHSKEPKLYRALANGIDHKQGFVPVGTVFATTQPQGSWMEEVEPDEPKAKGKAKASE